MVSIFTSMTYYCLRCDDESKRRGCMCGWHSHIWLCHTVTQWKKKEKQWKNVQKMQWKLCLLYCNIPVHTREPTVWVHGVPQCAEIYYRTRTHATHFGNTAGFSVPVLNPNPIHPSASPCSLATPSYTNSTPWVTATHDNTTCYFKA